MKKHLQMVILILIASLVSSPSAQESALSGRDIMLKVDNRPDGDNVRETITMTLINKNGKTRERAIQSFSKEYGKDSKSLMFFEKPADVMGVGFLAFEYDDPAKEDDKWLYMPALKNVRRISGSSRGDYFMGTDFTYDDMGDRSVDEDVHILLREEMLNKRKCWIVESVAKDKNYMYSKVISWIDQEALITVKVDYYDKQSALLKTLTVPEFRVMDGFWTIVRMEMNNLQEKHRTIIQMTDIIYDKEMDDNLFRVSTLERGRVK